MSLLIFLPISIDDGRAEHEVAKLEMFVHYFFRIHKEGSPKGFITVERIVQPSFQSVDDLLLSLKDKKVNHKPEPIAYHCYNAANCSRRFHP